MLGRFLAFIRRSLMTAMLLVCLTCAVEVGFRVHTLVQPHAADRSTVDQVCGIPVGPCPISYLGPRPMSAFRMAGKTRWHWNGWGLRGAEPIVPKPSDAFRVVWLGGPRVLEAETSESQTAVVRLARLMQSQNSGPTASRDVEIINAGRPVGCPLASLLWIKHWGIGLQPDLVLVEVDVCDSAQERTLRRRLISDRAGHAVAAPHPSCARSAGSRWSLDAWRQEFRTIDWALQQAGRLVELPESASEPEVDPADDSIAQDSFLRSLTELSDVCQSWSKSLVVCITDDGDATLTEPRQQLAESLKRLGVPWRRFVIDPKTGVPTTSIEALASYLQTQAATTAHTAPRRPVPVSEGRSRQYR